MTHNNIARQEEIARYSTFALLICVLMAIIFFLCFADFTSILVQINDDAYYFFKVSENVAGGFGTTFDGIHKTNGFQPLWMLILVPVFWLCPDSPETAFRIGLLIQALFLFAAPILIISVLNRFFSWRAILGTVVCYTFLVFIRALNGLESAVEILAMSALFAFAYHAKLFFWNDDSILRQFIFGLLLGILMLARLDLVFIAIVIVSVRMWPLISYNRRNNSVLWGTLAILCGALIFVMPYLLYNFVFFGKITPISGLLKSSFPLISFASAWSSLLFCVGLPRLIFILLIVFFAAAYVIYTITKSKATYDAKLYYHTSLFIFACAIALHFLHTVLFMKWAVMTWHFFPYFLFVSLAIVFPLEKLISFRIATALYWFAVFALVIAGIVGNCIRMIPPEKPNWPIASYTAALWARAHTDPSDIFALKDTGNFGYYSRRRVINLDGLVNNLEYQEVLKNKELQSYFVKNHVKYLVRHSTMGTNVIDGSYNSLTVTFPSKLYMVDSDPIVLYKKDEAYRTYYSVDSVKDTFVIWNISSPRDAR